MKKTRFLRGLSTSLAFISALLICGELIATSSSDYKSMIDGIFGVNFTNSSGDVDSYMFNSQFENTKQLYTHRAEVATKISEEGCVLLKNDNNVLPLDNSKGLNVTVLGSRAFTYDNKDNLRDVSGDKSLAFYAGIVGSKTYKQSVTLEDEVLDLPITLEMALKEQNININPSCKDVYTTKNFPSYVKGSEANGSQGGPYSVNEPYVTKNDFKNIDKYNDACIVVIGRTSGEGREYFPGQNGIEDKNDGSKSALNLSDNERNLIHQAKEISDKVIVLINSAVAMEINELKEELKDEVDSVLWIGLPGLYGLRGVSRVLTGVTSPSGSLPDTYAVDASMSPAAQNFGVTSLDGQSFTWSNAGYYNKADNGHYVVLAEDLYTGYYYYETRYYDSIVGNGNASSSKGVGYGAKTNQWKYEDEVSYTFGYGLSYTDFSLEILENENGTKYKYNPEDKSLTFDVLVTNTGNYPGKKAVQLYASSPYTQYDKDHKIEKSAIQLVNFEKTDILYPSDVASEDKPNSQKLSIKADLKYFASYDETAYHDGKTGGYILEDADYYFAFGNGAHEAINNVLVNKDSAYNNLIYNENNATANPLLSVKWNPSQETDLINSDGGTFVDGINATLLNTNSDGVIVENQLQDADYNYFESDKIKYLSRSDWDSTFPTGYGLLSVHDKMKKYLGTNENNAGRVYEFKSGESTVEFGVDHSEEEDPITEEPLKNRTIAEYKGKSYSDPEWDYLLQQITFDEAWKFSPYGGTNCEPFMSVNAPTVWQIDGPNGNVTREVGKLAPTSGVLSISKDDPNWKYMSADMPCEPVTAATFNKKLIEEQGVSYGEDGIWGRNTIIWAPGMNLHRTPFNSRNHEYYSEDPMLTNIMGTSFTRGAVSKGMIVAAKHFAFNTQESYREGLCQFMEEQSARELELRAFQGLSQDVKYVNPLGNEINGLGLMTSFSRIGVCGVNAHTGLMKNILRGEWGFKGLISTDMVVGGRFFNPQDSVINNVTFMATSNASNLLTNSWHDYNNRDLVKNDPYLCEAMYQNMHYYMYAIANSNALNGIAPDSVIIDTTSIMSPWEIALIAGSISTGVISVVLFGIYTFLNIKKNKDSESEVA